MKAINPVQYFFVSIILIAIYSVKPVYPSQRPYGETLHYTYIIIYESEDQISLEKKQRIQRRLDILTRIIEKESLNNLHIEVKPLYVDVHTIGHNELSYNTYTFFEWADLLMEMGNIHDNTDVVSITPAIKMPWASDSRSIGFYYRNRVWFSLEYYAYNKTDNIKAISLLIHKMLHGFGYNHQNINMPALKLLNWEVGFPVNTGLEYALRQKDGYDAFYFNEHLMDVLNYKHEKPNPCPDCNGLFSKSNKYIKGWTEDAYGPFCYDADHDGILDQEDDYFLSSPVKGTDSDEDGIPDQLDLISWNQLTVRGNIDAGKINLIGKEDHSEIYFSGPNVNIKEIRTMYLKKVPVLYKPDHFPGYFPANKTSVFKGNKVDLILDKSKSPVVRIEVHYTYKDQSYYRPYYFYFPGSRVLQIINEREWYYFSRFGADIPADISFYHVKSYDENFDGMLDKEKNKYFMIPEDYDWDGDGFPDYRDNLQTVNGDFENEYVRGVKDSDNDGLADPGCLDFSEPGPKISSKYYFGEIFRIIGSNREYDRSPYISNTIKALKE